MKFTAVLTGLAISAFQVVHATPTGLESTELETLTARDDPGYCCSVYADPYSIVTLNIPRGSDTFIWNTVRDCEVEVTRNPNNCDGWKFYLRPNCQPTHIFLLEVQPAEECQQA
ncbi:hypothetical protein E4U17_005915 [Claviceps sp. LM77 group G4]|nr:hypothetical protein E4U17_005915 [Claviceps sp. LM77 group G4]KAG6066737.1 hypothetical protein E4U33_005484 [Claviceps sp. LM78 group G4]KAG6071420.1 hypothetical protein E4U16_006128 [Claviceps sp. LM84 group G4]